MNRSTVTLLLASVLAAPTAVAQEPDLSTPERAFAAFSELWRAATQDRARWDRMAEEAEAGSLACCTDALRTKLAERSAKARDMADKTAFVWGAFEVSAPAPGGDTAMLVVHLAMKIRTPTFGTGSDAGYTEKDHREPYRFHYRKVGDQWRIEALWKVCPSCSGTGSCTRCGGRGAGPAGSCAACGGRGRCGRCDGKVMVPDALTHHLLVAPGTLLHADTPFEPSTDLTGARSATKAYMDSWISRERIRGRAIVARLRELMPRFEAFLTPANADAARLVLDGELERAHARLAGVVHEITALTERESEAFAMTRARVDGVDYTCGLLLEKVEARWLVAATLTQKCVHCAGSSTCMQCQGNGKCAICAGTGKAGGYDCTLCGAKGACFGCKGVGGCGACRGFGWVAED